MAPIADAVFDAAAAGHAAALLEAWVGALAYTLQLYFDFSGYSDMAIGLALMFGIRLPLNFNSPYKATNIIEFWRRWHMTLSRFLRDYLYIPLGGNRTGRVAALRQPDAHDAARRALARRRLDLRALGRPARRSISWSTTAGMPSEGARVRGEGFAARARRGESGDLRVRGDRVGLLPRRQLSRGHDGAAGMFLGNGISLPASFAGRLHAPQALVDLAHIRFDGPFRNELMDPGLALEWVLVLGLIAWYAPNTQEIMGRYRPGLGFTARDHTGSRHPWLQWRPNYVWSILVALLAVAALVNLWIGSNAEFIYFQF